MIVGCPIVFGLLLFNGVGGGGQVPARSSAAAVTIAEVVRQPMFVRLLVPFVLVAVATGGVVVHFVPMLIDAGYTPSRAGQMASLVGLSLVSARLLVGIVLDYAFAPTVATVLTAASAVGFLGLAVSDNEFLLGAAIVTGLSLGAELDLIAYLASRCFPPNHFSRAYSLLYSAFLISVALSPVIYAGLREWGGDYRPAFACAAIFLAASSICFARLRRGATIAA
jgi:cyanate permease